MNALILTDYGRPVNVVGYNPDNQPLTNVPTVGAAVAYDNPTTGETIILTINQALYIPSLKHNLLCPMQCRMNQVEVNDVPKFLKLDDHAVIIPNDALGPKRIPLSLHGIIRYFPTRKPLKQEYEQSEYHCCS